MSHICTLWKAISELTCWGCRVSLKPVMHNEVVSQVQTMTTLLEGVLASKGLLDSQVLPASSVSYLTARMHACRCYSQCVVKAAVTCSLVRLCAGRLACMLV